MGGRVAGFDLDLRSRAVVVLDGGWKKAEKRTGRELERWDGTDAHQPPKRERWWSALEKKS